MNDTGDMIISEEKKSPLAGYLPITNEEAESNAVGQRAAEREEIRIKEEYIEENREMIDAGFTLSQVRMLIASFEKK